MQYFRLVVRTVLITRLFIAICSIIKCEIANYTCFGTLALVFCIVKLKTIRCYVCDWLLPHTN